MSPEFYAIIGVGVSTMGLLSGLMIFLFSLLSRRMDRLETRMDRLESQFMQRMDRMEDKVDRLLEQTHQLDLRVSKLEWMLDAALYGKPVRFPPEADTGDNDSERPVT